MAVRGEFTCGTWGRQMWVGATLGLLSLFLGPTALTHDSTVPPGPFIPGPFTIRGVVLAPNGKPLPGYPVRLLPVLPGKGVDADNSYYRIPRRNEHGAVTDADGRFVMTNVIDYPQVKERTYKVVRAKWNDRYPYTHSYKSDVVPLDRCTDPAAVIDVTIRLEPCALVKIVVHDRAGRPFTGTRALSVATGHDRRILVQLQFENGVAYLGTPSGDVQSPGRIVLLRWETAAQARREAAEHGQPTEGQGRGLITYGAVGSKNVLLIPGQTITAEFTADL